MVDIGTAESNIDAIALVQRTTDPDTSGVRWLLYVKADGLYLKSEAGVVIGPLTSTVSVPSAPSDLLSILTAAEIAVSGATAATIGRMHVCSGTTADYTITLPAAAGNAGKLIGFRMASALTKLVTLDGNAAEKIDNVLTRIMWAGESAILLCDGANWYKIAGKTIPMLCVMSLSANQSAFVTATVTKVNIDTVDIDNTGLMADIANKRIICKRPGNYQLGAKMQISSLSAVSNRTISWAYKNGAGLNDVQCEGVGNVGTLWAQEAAGTVVLAVVDYIELNGMHMAGSNQVIRGGSGNSRLRVQEIPAW